MKAIEIIKTIEKYVPLSAQEEWDQSGLQIGDINQDIHKIMISLNCDADSINECIAQGCNMLITHHPFLLDKVENYSSDNFISAVLEKCYKHHIVVYSCHTSLDNTYMNKWLIEALGIKAHHPFDNCTMCETGTLESPLTCNEFIDLVKESYHLEHFKFAGNKEVISNVAVLGGSGADLLEELNNKVDVFITGDTKYRHAKYAVDHNMLLVDINHHSESIMIDHLKNLIKDEIDADIIEYYASDYYHYL